MDKIFGSLSELAEAAFGGWRPATGDLVMWPGKVAMVVEGGWLIGDKLYGYEDDDGEKLAIDEFFESIS
jgi:hypothetical protein